MTVYRVQGPDGQVHRFEGPDGASPEDIVAAAAKQFGHYRGDFAKQADAQADIKANDPSLGMSPTELALAALQKKPSDVRLGLQQRGADIMAALPQSGPLDLSQQTRWQQIQKDLQAQAEEKSRLDAPLMARGPAIAGSVAGDVATMALPGGLLRTAGAVAKSPRMIALAKDMIAPKSIPGASVLGAELGAIQPTSGNESAGMNALLSGLGGGLGQATGKVGGMLIRGIDRVPNLEREKLLGIAAEQGIPLTASQKTGSLPLKWLESGMENLPFTSGKMEQVKESQRQAYNRAALKTLGEDADKVTPEVLNNARLRLGSEFERLTKGKDIKLGNDFFNQIADVDEADAKTWESLRSPKVSRIVDDALDMFGKGKISSEEYQRVRSVLSQESKDAFASKNSQLGQSLKSIRKALDDAAEGSLSEDDKLAWQLARKQWGNLKTIEKSVGTGEESALGNIPPQKLAAQVVKSNPQGMRYGTGDQALPNLARLGQGLFKTAPNSGTAQRALAQKLLTLGYGGAGVGLGTYGASGSDESNQQALLAAALLFGGPKAIQAAYMNPASQRMLTQGIAGRSPTAQLLAELLKQGSFAGGAAAPLALTPP